jgi:hypothetical protein
MMYLNGNEYFERTDYDKVIVAVRANVRNKPFKNMGTVLDWGTLLEVRKMNYLSLERLLNRVNDLMIDWFNREPAMKFERIVGLCLKLRGHVSETYQKRWTTISPRTMTSECATQYEHFLHNCALELILVEFKFYME